VDKDEVIFKMKGMIEELKKTNEVQKKFIDKMQLTVSMNNKKWYQIF
jgi:hypothetical protein